MINESLDTSNINAINISTLDFRIWQYFDGNWTLPNIQKLASVPEVPIAQLYQCMIDTTPIHTFNKDDEENPSLIWTILKHPGTYIGTMGMKVTVCIAVYCFKKFRARPANLDTDFTLQSPQTML